MCLSHLHRLVSSGNDSSRISFFFSNLIYSSKSWTVSGRNELQILMLPEINCEVNNSKFLLEVLSTLQSSSDEVLLPLYWKMAENPNVPSRFMVCLRESLLNSRIGWFLRFVLRPRSLSPEEIISSNSGAGPSNAEIPDRFMEIFRNLPQVPMNHMLRMLDWNDIFRLQLVAGPFTGYFANNRRNYALNHLVHGSVDLLGTEFVRVRRYHNNHLTINHAQFVKSLETVNMSTFLIRQEGELRAASFHIPLLTCQKLELRIVNPIEGDDESELMQIFEQIIENSHIKQLNLIGRKVENPRELQTRLDNIASRSLYLIREQTNIVIIRP
ncbi:F-box C protein [Caenorhabditis elegans]|uniref:F-box C protein n=2 Tax=Caenorhabditis elegans TaxID=6239 RepID=W6SBJ5_CAEEL|nr:F-box C protein [Caenorhabditis elegans]CDM63564.1 F-box C protein [Caenorhabditis elegans]|eukprot:NP_001294198.1 Uncharacterized protein CELE_F55G1.7 [Caenorhabditis elegans]